MSYDRGFYDTIRAGCQASAAEVVPVVLAMMPWVKTVIDVGCGEGWWAQAFADRGCAAVGVDGAYVQGSPLGTGFLVHDLRKPLVGERWDAFDRFDLAVSLEVAEHLPPARADSFVADLCRLAPTVLFSAAIPGQGGTGHINEQWPAYWAERFAANGYQVSGALRWRFWDNARVENWYRQNLLVATRDPQLLGGLFSNTALAHPWPVVHPVLYDARRAQ